MPDPALVQDALHDELDRVSRKLRLATIARDAARLLSDGAIQRSDMAWMASIFVGDVGTAVAVTQGQASGQWASKAQDLDETIQELQIRRQMLELMITLRG